MAPTREDFQLLLQIEQVFKTSKEAKKFVWSEAVEDGDGWFDRHGWDSDERMYVNEYSTYFEVFAMAWKSGAIDEELVLEWVPAVVGWQRVGQVLLEARRVLDAPDLWTGFEALAKAQREQDASS
jgi:hypothetical protein